MLTLERPNLSQAEEAFLVDLRTSIRAWPRGQNFYDRVTSAWFKGAWYEDIPSFEFEEEITRAVEEEGCRLLGFWRTSNVRKSIDPWNLWICRVDNYDPLKEDPDITKIRPELPLRAPGEAMTTALYQKFLLAIGGGHSGDDDDLDYSNPHLSAPYAGIWLNPVYAVQAFFTFDERRQLRRHIATVLGTEPINVPWLTIESEHEDTLNMGQLKQALLLFGEGLTA